MKQRNQIGITAIISAVLYFCPSMNAAAVTTTEPASVVAEKGPVQLRLDVLRTRIHPGDSILLRLTLKNVGKKGFVVTDGLFAPHADLVGVLSMVGSAGFGIDLELRNSAGTVVGWDLPFSDGFCTEPGKESTPWDHTDISTAPEQSTAPDTPFSRWLKPGESIKTGPWIQGGACPRPMTEEERSSGFAQMPAKLKPGMYSIRAVYDYRKIKSFRRPGHSLPEAVKVVTDPISLQVKTR
jgi:hypothetical protein